MEMNTELILAGLRTSKNQAIDAWNICNKGKVDYHLNRSKDFWAGRVTAFSVAIHTVKETVALKFDTR